MSNMTGLAAVKTVYPFQNEHVLNSSSESLENKIKALIKTWREFGSLKCMPSDESFRTLSQYLKNHTLNIVLSANWLRLKDIYYKQLVHVIDRSSTFFRGYTSFQLTCKKLVTVAKTPWERLPIIEMLNCTKPLTEIKDYNFFVYEESGYIISMRLHKLCEERCEDMALNLTRAYIRCCEWADMYDKNMYITQDQRKFVFDVYLALLYKLNQTKEMSGMLKQMTLAEGVDMVRRFTSKILTASKIWLHSTCIAQLSGTIFLTRSVMQPVGEIEQLLIDLLQVWLATYENERDQEDLIACLRRIMKNAFTSSHMYIIVKQIDCKFGVRMRNYNVEVYIQALNTDMNLLERQKSDNDNDEKVLETTTRLADALLRLASLLEDNLRVSRECILSAFSLRPSQESLLQIEGAARASGYNVLDTGQWTCRFHPPPPQEEDLLIMCDTCNDFMSELKLHNPALKQPNTALSEALRTNRMGLSEEICDDLVVIIFCARYQLLSWLQRWEDLHRLCILYLNDPCKTKNLITELKYLEKDYTPFMLKREMEIAELNELEENIFSEYSDLKKKRKRKRVVPSGDENDGVSDDECLCRTIKDPETVRTLRLFRKSLKSMPVEPEQSTVAVEEVLHPNLVPESPIVTNESTSSARTFDVLSSLVDDEEDTSLNESRVALHIRKDLFESTPPGFQETNESQSIFANTSEDNSNFSREPVIQPKIEEEVNDIESDDLVSAVAEPVDELDNGADINDIHLDLEAEKRLLEGPDSCDSLHEFENLFGGTDIVSLNQIMEQAVGRLFVKDELEEETIEQEPMIVSDELTCDITNNGGLIEQLNPLVNSTDVEMKVKPLANLTEVEMEVNPDANLTEVEMEVSPVSNLKKMKIETNPISNSTDVMIEMNSVVNSTEVEMKVKPLANSTEVEMEVDPVANLTEVEMEVSHVADLKHIKIETSPIANLTEVELEKNPVATNPPEIEVESSRLVGIESDLIESKVETTVDNYTLGLNSQVLANVNDSEESKQKYNYKEASTDDAELDTPTENISVQAPVEKLPPLGSMLTMQDSETVKSGKVIGGRTRSSKATDKLDLYKKYNLRECRIVLSRVKEPIVTQKPARRKRKYVRKTIIARGRPRKIQINNPETNIVMQEGNKDENYNSLCNVQKRPIRKASVLEALKKKLLVESDKMNPRVVLQRLDDSCMKSLLARVPGVTDTNLMRPEGTDRVVNVVQVAGGRTPSSVPSGNTQTSTQVSPHIQRIGQPRNEKTSESSNSESATSDKATSNSYKSAATQSPTLINMLTQQIHRPSHSTRSRTGQIINIISQQSIKPVIKIESSPTSPTSQDLQANNTSRTAPINNDTSSNSGPMKPIDGGKKFQAQSIPIKLKSEKTQAVSTSTDITNVQECSKAKVASNKSKEVMSETLPKFQQAFGKSVYQNSVDSTNATTNNLSNNVTDDIEKDKQHTKNASVSMQPIQGSVIYTRQVPVGQTINLIPQTRGQVFRIATSTNPKDTVIQNKMNALLAAALQGKTKSSEPVPEDSDTPDSNVQNGVDSVGTARIQVAQPSLVQTSRIVKPVLQIPTNVIRNTPQTNLSSTTLEQLREFDMVYKQVTERSSTSTPADAGSAASTESNDSTTPPQCISVTYLNQTQKLNCSSVVVVSSYNSLQPAVSPALSVASQGSSSPCVTPASTPTPVLPKVAVKSTKGGGKTIKTAVPIHPAKTSPNIPKPQQKSQEDEQTTQRIFDILAEYAEQLRNSPDLNNKPAPRRRSNPPTNPSQNSKRKKSSSSKKSGQCSLSSDVDIDDPRTAGSEDSSCGIVQISMQDDEQTSVAGNASESNDSTPTTTTTRQQLILTDSSHTQTRNLIIADSSVGEALKMPNTAVLVPGNYIMPVSMVKGGQQIAVVSGGSKILATVPARSGPNMLLFQSFLNQTRKTNVSTVKYSTIQPISGISSQTLAGVSAQPPVILPPPGHISTVTLGQPIAIKTIEETERVNTEIVLTISQSRDTSHTPTEDTPQPDSSTSLITKLESDMDENTAMSENSSDKISYHKQPLKSTSTSSSTSTIAASIATPVIAHNIKIEESSDPSNAQAMMTLNINPMDVKGEKNEERRIQSVLVTAGSSNLSRSPSRSKQLGTSSSSGSIVVTATTAAAAATATNTTATVIKSEPTPKEKFIKHTHKKNDKTQQNHAFCVQGKMRTKTAGGRMDKDGGQQFGTHRRQEAMDREIRLQKSLSEECEDLGVDEPNSCDLFPEALLFDAHNSPSFEQTSQELLRRNSVLQVQQQGKADEHKLTLFADDDLMFNANHHPSSDTKKQYCQKEMRTTHKVVINGQCSIVASAVPNAVTTVAATTAQCKDNTLLQTSTSMSDVTLSSPLSPDKYHANTPPATNKCMLKYSNKKKADRKAADLWPIEVSSSEDAMTDRMKSSSSADLCTNVNPRSAEDVGDNALSKVVHVSISKTECSDNHCESDCDSISGRGSRKGGSRKCTCCSNGATEGCSNSRKRPSTQQQHISSPHKKSLSTKKDNMC